MMRRAPKYISTEAPYINVHQDGGSSGRPQQLLAAKLPRTVLSAANAAESPTATLVKREMQSWRLLQLEPSALREPDSFAAPVELASNGAHLAAAIFHLANTSNGGVADPDSVYAQLANQVAQLVEDVRSVSVDRDERRQLLTVYVQGRDKTAYPVRALSGGTLRFLALSVLSIDQATPGVICMEEPENGIHPERIPAMIQLLQGLTTDVQATDLDAIGESTRQVIVNTHSPAVVMAVPEDSLVLASTVEMKEHGRSFSGLEFRALTETWRARQPNAKPIPKGKLLAYLNPVGLEPALAWTNGKGKPDSKSGNASRRVVDRDDIRQYKIDFSGING
jgi:predicted ATPase